MPLRWLAIEEFDVFLGLLASVLLAFARARTIGAWLQALALNQRKAS
jgi:hypothetical protein